MSGGRDAHRRDGAKENVLALIERAWRGYGVSGS